MYNCIVMVSVCCLNTASAIIPRNIHGKVKIITTTVILETNKQSNTTHNLEIKKRKDFYKNTMFETVCFM